MSEGAGRSPASKAPGPGAADASVTTGSGSSANFFQERFGLDENKLGDALSTALENRVDAADLFFEYSALESVVLEEGIVKNGDRHIEQGVGVRARVGERQGYAHSDEISIESVGLAARTARAISTGGGSGGSVAVSGRQGGRDLYPVATAPTDVPVERKIELLGRIDEFARGLDSRISQVMASATCQNRHTLVATSDGTLVGDVLPMVRVNVQVIAASGEQREVGYQGMGGRYEFERLLAEDA